MRIRSSPFWAVLTAAGFAVTARAQAPDASAGSVEGAPLQLAPITITAQPEPVSTLKTPTSVDVVEGRDVQKAHPKTAMETIQDQPGVDILQTGPTLSRPVVEGLSEQNVVITEDGVRHEVQPWGIEHAPMIDPLTIGRVEVVRGAASLLYGSDALGGVVSVFHPDLPSAALGAGPLSGQILSAFDSMNSRVGLGTVVQGAQGDWGYRANYSQDQSGNFATPSGTIPNTAAQNVAGDGALGLTKDWGSLKFAYGHVHRNVELQEVADWADPTQQDAEHQELDHDVASVSAKIKGSPVRWDLAGGYDAENRREFGTNNPRDNTFSANDAEFPVVQWIQHNYYADVKAHHDPLGPLQGTIGVTGWLRDQSSNGPVPLIPSFNEGTVGEYVFEELPAGKFTFNAGIRGDETRYDVHAKATDPLGANLVPSQTLNYTSVTGAVGGVYRISEPMSLAVNVGRGYRNPIPFELFAFGVHEGTGRFEIGNPNLKPMTSINTDAELRYVTKRFRANVLYYYNTFQDFIYSAPITAAQTAALAPAQQAAIAPGSGDNADGDTVFVQTQGRATIQGGSVSGQEAVLDWLDVSEGFDILRGQNNSIDEPLPLIPQDRVLAGLTLHERSLGVLRDPYLGVNFKHAFAQNRTTQDFPSTPVSDYTLVGLTLGTALNAGGSRVTIDAGVDNLLNVDYQDILNVYRPFFIEMPGRNAWARVGIPFGS